MLEILFKLCRKNIKPSLENGNVVIIYQPAESQSDNKEHPKKYALSYIDDFLDQILASIILIFQASKARVATQNVFEIFFHVVSCKILEE